MYYSYKYIASIACKMDENSWTFYNFLLKLEKNREFFSKNCLFHLDYFVVKKI